MKKKQKDYRVSVRNQPEAKVLKAINASIFEAREVLRRCEEQKVRPNKWVALYAAHTASLLGKLRLARRNNPAGIPEEAQTNKRSSAVGDK